MGLCNGSIDFIGDDKQDIALRTADSLFDPDIHSLITIIYGESMSEEDALALEQQIKDKHGDSAEISLVDGGQPVYYYIISVE